MLFVPIVNGQLRLSIYVDRQLRTVHTFSIHKNYSIFAVYSVHYIQTQYFPRNLLCMCGQLNVLVLKHAKHIYIFIGANILLAMKVPIIETRYIYYCKDKL